jgi:hypothetical protein
LAPGLVADHLDEEGEAAAERRRRVERFGLY